MNKTREKLKFIDGIDSLKDSEVNILYENLKPILESGAINPEKGTYIVSKDKLIFDETKNRVFCCGYAEYKILCSEGDIYFAYDFGI